MSSELTLHRILRAPRARIWSCWTRADLIPHWFVPKPHTVEECILDLRPGGRFFTAMRVGGVLHPGDGSILAVEHGRLLVFTDLMLADWQPVASPGLGFTAALHLADHPDGTDYRVVARHRNGEDAARHEAMGFTTGWGIVADQLEAFAAGLRE
jgi:uncharacterized protein YndB with AHSA1/START domain